MLKQADGDRLFFYVKRESHVLELKTIPNRYTITVLKLDLHLTVPITKRSQSDYLSILKGTPPGANRPVADPTSGQDSYLSPL